MVQGVAQTHKRPMGGAKRSPPPHPLSPLLSLSLSLFPSVPLCLSLSRSLILIFALSFSFSHPHSLSRANSRSLSPTCAPSTRRRVFPASPCRPIGPTLPRHAHPGSVGGRALAGSTRKPRRADRLACYVTYPLRDHAALLVLEPIGHGRVQEAAVPVRHQAPRSIHG